MIDWFVVGIMTVLLIGQHVFWSRVTHKLIDKLMSRDYQNYAEIEKYLKNKPPRLATPQVDDAVDPTSAQQAQELNSILGMV